MDVVDSLEREKGVFRSMLPELRKKYEGKYVAIKDGAVISVGSSKEETAFKAYEKWAIQSSTWDMWGRRGRSDFLVLG